MGGGRLDCRLAGGGRALNGRRIDWTELLFSSTGRIGRGLFLALAALVLVVTLIYRRWIGAPAWTGWIVYPALLFCAACILCKRLHDRGRAGWWAGLVLLAVGTVSWPVSYDWRAAILLIAVVDLGLWPGQKGGNRFGPG